MMKDFTEVSENYTLAEAIKEAQRCLNCKVPGCKKGCPINNDIPEWIYELSHGNFGNAIHIIHTKSNLPAVCGRVCGHERQCQGSCVLGKKGEPVNIGKLEKFLADFDAEAGWSHNKIPQKTRGKVAVIGSGPAGLTIAGDLARKGFAVDIFEMEKEAGGMLKFGIPEYRLPKEVVSREIKKIEGLGVNIHLNTTVGVDLTIDDLFGKGFDAIFMGSGTGVPNRPDIPGIDHFGVRQGIRFLRRVGLYESGYIKRKEVVITEGDRVVVIGCGNTAMDAARTALRMGASEVTVVYHRGIENMSALRAEYDEAVEEGVKFLWHSSVIDIKGKEDNVKLEKVTIKTGDEVFEKPLEHVILAIGSVPASRIVSSTEGIEVDEKGYVLTREYPYGMTTRKGVFAGGDVARRQATVVHAMEDAKKVAEGIAQYVDAMKLMESIEQNTQSTEAPAESTEQSV